MTASIARGEQRFALPGYAAAHVSILRQAGEAPLPISAELMDLSPGGARLALAMPLLIHESVKVRIQVPEVDFDVTLCADVCWLRPQPQDVWWLGCSFQPKIPADTLARLAVTGQLDRRRHARLPLAAPAKARWPLEGDLWAVTLRDYSPGGFCLLAPAGERTGNRLLLEISAPDEPPVSINARVLWEMAVQDGVLLGCEFRDNLGPAALAQVVDLVLKMGRARRRRWPRLWIGAGIFAVILYGFLRAYGW